MMNSSINGAPGKMGALPDISKSLGVSSILSVFGTTSQQFVRRMEKFAEEYVTVDEDGNYVVKILDPATEEFDFSKEFTYETAIPMAIGYAALKEGLLSKNFHEWPENWVDDVIERITISMKLEDGRNHMASASSLFEADGGISAVRDNLYTDGLFMCLPDGYDSGTLLAGFQIPYSVWAVTDGNGENFGEMDLARNEIRDLISDLKKRTVPEGAYYEVSSNRLVEDKDEDCELTSMFDNIGTLTTEKVSLTIGNKVFEIGVDDFKSGGRTYKNFCLRCCAANVANMLAFSDASDGMRTLGMEGPNDVWLDTTVTFNAVEGFVFVPEVANRISVEEEWLSDSTGKEAEASAQNIKFMEKLLEFTNNGNYASCSELKTAMIAHKEDLVAIRGREVYDGLFEQVKILASFEKDPSQILGNPVANSLYA